MSNINKLVNQSKLFVKKNAPTILTVVGGVGVVATTVTAIKSTPKALQLLEVAKEEKGEELTAFDKLIVAGPVYIPTVLLGASTLACIFGANFLNKRQQAALMSAYALLDSSFKEYRGKLKELYGGEADTRINEEIAKDNFDSSIVVEDDKQLFYDLYSRRYFESTIVDVQQAEYALNHELNSRGEVTLNDWYSLIGLDPIDGGEALGWSSGLCFEYYWKSWIDFNHHKTTMDDGLECTIIELLNEPMIEYLEY